MKRIPPLLLTIVLSLSLAVPAFADIITDDPALFHARPVFFSPILLIILLIVVITAIIARSRKK